VSSHTYITALYRETDPSVEPITLAEAKLYLKVDHAADDLLISELIQAVRQSAENYTGKSTVTQQWRLISHFLAGEGIRLPMGPVQSVQSVTVIHSDGSSEEITASAYVLMNDRQTLHFSSCPPHEKLEIIYTAGYGAAEDVPVSIRQGMLAQLAMLYDERGQGTGLPEVARALYQPYREVRI
jgi:uncharacterized phiE125 gp8 family phage protein